MAALRILSAAGRAFRKVIIWTSADEGDVATSPTITSGSADPTGASTEPDGSVYLRTGATAANNAIYVTASSTWVVMDGT